MLIDPTIAAGGGEWNIGGLDGGTISGPGAGSGTGAAGGTSGFGGMLTEQIGQLEGLQNQAATASASLAAGTAADPTAVVMAVERARLGMQLAAQIRTKAVEAIQDVFHTQV